MILLSWCHFDLVWWWYMYLKCTAAIHKLARVKKLPGTRSRRPANFILENWDKLHSWLWAKSWLDTNFQPIRKSFDHVYEAPKVPGLVGISPIWGPSEPHTRGQTTSKLAENWCPVRIWSKVNGGVCPSFPKKIGVAYCTGTEPILWKHKCSYN